MRYGQLPEIAKRGYLVDHAAQHQNENDSSGHVLLIGPWVVNFAMMIPRISVKQYDQHGHSQHFFNKKTNSEDDMQQMLMLASFMSVTQCDIM